MSAVLASPWSSVLVLFLLLLTTKLLQSTTCPSPALHFCLPGDSGALGHLDLPTKVVFSCYLLTMPHGVQRGLKKVSIQFARLYTFWRKWKVRVFCSRSSKSLPALSLLHPLPSSPHPTPKNSISECPSSQLFSLSPFLPPALPQCSKTLLY